MFGLLVLTVSQRVTSITMQYKERGLDFPVIFRAFYGTINYLEFRSFYTQFTVVLFALFLS